MANYEDDTPLSSKVEWFLRQALPDDIYAWFLEQIGEKPLTGRQGMRLVQWLCIDVKKAIINKNNVKKIRKARKEEFIEVIKQNLPTPGIMANVTKDQLEGYEFEESVTSILIPHLSLTLKRDEATVTIALQWSLRGKLISQDDMQWMVRYCKPANEFEQVLLL